MTPLAHRIVKEMTLPVRQRTFKDHARLLPLMSDLHCFDLTEVFGIAGDLAEDLHRRAVKKGALQLMETQTFLPAPRTWLEWRRNGMCEGVLLEQGRTPQAVGGADFAYSYWASAGYDMFLSARQSGKLVLSPDPLLFGGSWPSVRNLHGETEDEQRGWIFTLYALLAIINTPRLIGRKQHMPHRGLERALVRAQPLIGQFPLHAWTELTLSASAMMQQANGVVHEAHLTGERCLHFCRAHLRVRNGQLQQVKAHWRGNPSIGTRQTRYRLVA